jgi:hypothetical protein
MDRLDSGASVDEAFQAARQFEIEDGVHARSAAVHTINALRKSYGDAKIRDVLGQLILKQPFVVRRKYFASVPNRRLSTFTVFCPGASVARFCGHLVRKRRMGGYRCAFRPSRPDIGLPEF